MNDVHLRIEGLTKDFTLHVLGGKRVPAFRDVTFDVARGGLTAIVGPSGSGKSSLLKCIYRTYLPIAGHMMFAGRMGTVDLVSADDHAVLALRRREIGYVSQFLKPPPRVSALDVVARPLIERGETRDTAREAAAAMLTRLNVPRDLFDGYPTLFSGGEQQRVNIARALLSRADFLLLDEPTSALDQANLHVVSELLREDRVAGTTILGIFHDPAVVAALADTVIIMTAGTVQDIAPGSVYARNITAVT